jgi:hypothetical protein
MQSQLLQAWTTSRDGPSRRRDESAIKHSSKTCVCDQIFPEARPGFSDVVPNGSTRGSLAKMFHFSTRHLNTFKKRKVGERFNTIFVRFVNFISKTVGWYDGTLQP